MCRDLLNTPRFHFIWKGINIDNGENKFNGEVTGKDHFSNETLIVNGQLCPSSSEYELLSVGLMCRDLSFPVVGKAI